MTRPVEADVAIRFYKKHRGEATKNIGLRDYERLKNVLAAAEHKNMLLPRGVYSDTDELLAAGIFLVSKGRIVYLMGSASSKGREARAMYDLFDHVIMQFSDHPMVLDFEGSEIPGVARFFKGFGSEKRPYYKLVINRLPWIMRWLKG